MGTPHARVAHSAAASLDALTARDSRLGERSHTALGLYALTGRGDVRVLVGQPSYHLRLGDWRIIIELVTARRSYMC